MDLKYKWVPCTVGYYERNPMSRRVWSIVLHSTDGHKEGDIATLTGKTSSKVSVHWYVTKIGELYHFVDNNDIAWHAGVVNNAKYNNEHSAGIEQEHIDGQEPWPPALIRTTAALVSWMKKKYPGLVVASHASVAAPTGRKEDPKDYPWATFNALVAQFDKETINLIKE